MANGEFLEVLSPNALKDLQALNAELVKTTANVKNVNENMIGIKTPSGSDSAVKQLNEQYLAQEKLIKKLQTQIQKLTEIQNGNGKTVKNVSELEKERARIIRELEKTQAKITVSTEQNTIALNTQKSVLRAVAGAYAELSEKVKRASDNYQNIIARGKLAEQSQRQYNKELREAQSEFQKLQEQVLKADQAVQKWNRTGERTIAGLSELAYVFGWSGLLYMLKDFTLNVFNISKQLESQELALKNVVSSSYEFAKAQRFLKEISSQYGLEIRQLTTQYTQFYVNAKSKLGRQEIENIFKSIAKSAGFMGLSLQQQEKAFLAINQMMSKGTVQAEELRGQLAEALPGSVQALVRAYQKLHPELKVTEASFMKLMKDGKVLSAEVLPQMVVELEKLYGIENSNNVDTLTASVNRLSNAWTNFIDNLDTSENLFARIFKRMASDGAKGLNEIAEYLKSDADKRKEYLQKIGQAAEEKISRQIKANIKEIDQEAYATKMLEKLYKKREDIYLKAKDVQAKPAVWDKDVKEKREYIKKANEDLAKYDGFIRAFLTVLKKSDEAQIDGNKSQKERIRNNYEEAESLFNLRIARLEELRILQKEIQDNESATDYGRLEARKEYSRLSLEILEEQFAKENALADLKFKEDLEKANEVYLKNKKNGFDDVQNAEEYKKAIADITARYNNEKELSDINYSRKFKENAYSDAEFNEKVLKATFEKEEKYRKKTIEETEKLNNQINRSNQKKYQKIANDENKTLKARQLAFDEYKNLALLEIQIEQQKALAKADPTEYDTIIQKYKEQKEAIEGLETPLDVANRKTKEYLNSFQTDFINKGLEQLGLNSLKIFLDIDANGQSTFDKLIEGAKNWKEQMAVAVQSSMEIFQDLFNMMSERNNANFKEEYDILEKRKTIALAFAGDSDTARAEIERQAEQRRKEIAKREFKAKKEQAIFNIAIDTAQAIMATLGKTGFFGIPLTFIVGAIGAAQAIAVASQKMPEFYKGTDNAPEGLAWTQERGAEVITDKKGRVKTLGSNKGAVLTKLDAGDKVYTAQKSKQLMFNSDFSEVLFNSSLSNMMQSAGIGMSDTKPQIDIRQDLHQLGKDVVSAINNKTEYHQTFDNNGINNYISNGHTRKQIKNNHVTFTKQSF